MTFELQARPSPSDLVPVPSSPSDGASFEDRAVGRVVSGVLLVLLPFALLVAFRVLSSWSFVAPAIVDEMGYLGNARYLAGVGDLVAPGERSAYKIGYSLLLTPAYWIGGVGGAYRWVLLTNAVLLASVFLMMRHTIGLVVVGLTSVQRSAVAATAALLPGTIVYGATSFSHSARVTSIAAFLMLSAMAFCSDRRGWWFLAGGAAGFTYVVHESAAGLALLAAVIMTLLPLWLRFVEGEWRWGPLAGSVGVAMVVMAERSVYIAGTSYSTDTKGGGLISGAIDDWQGMAATAAGHAWYLSLASFGVLALGAALVILSPERRVVARATWAWWALSLLTVGSIFAVVAIGARDGATRAGNLTFLVYGRHMEVLVAVLVPLALAVIVRLAPSLTRRRYVAAGLLSLVPLLLAALALRISRPEAFLQGPYYLNVPALYPPYSIGWGGLAGVTLFALALSVATVVLFRWNWVVALLAVTYASVVLGQWSLDDFVQGFYDDRGEQHELATLAEEILPPGVGVAYDGAAGSNLHHVSYDYWIVGRDYGRREVETVDPGSLIISPDLDLHERVPGARAVSFETIPRDYGSYFMGLWSIPGSLQDELDERGWLLPVADPLYGAPVDPRATFAARRSGGAIELGVLNQGGSPWLSFEATKRDPRSVTVHVEVVRRSTGEVVLSRWIGLPETVHPGTSAKLTVDLPDEQEPGDLELVAGLRHDGRPIGPGPQLVPLVPDR